MARNAGAIVIHRIERHKIVEEWREGSGVLELTESRLQKEIGERERVEQDLRVKGVPAALVMTGVCALGAWPQLRVPPPQGRY